MTIEKIVCPVLNKPFTSSMSESKSNAEVFVKFDQEENPVSIICPYYTGKGTCGADNSQAGDKCIYLYWRAIAK